MPVLEAISISSVGKIIAAVWANGSRFLCSVAAGAAAAVAVIRVGAYLGIPKAQPWWDDYGLILILLAVVVAVFAAFKMRAEKRNTGLALIANEQQSFWHHAKQQDGSILTQFHLQFHATNTSERGLVYLSKVRLNWPWVNRDRILSSSLRNTRCKVRIVSTMGYRLANAALVCPTSWRWVQSAASGERNQCASASACKIISADGISWCFAGCVIHQLQRWSPRGGL